MATGYTTVCQKQLRLPLLVVLGLGQGVWAWSSSIIPAHNTAAKCLQKVSKTTKVNKTTGKRVLENTNWDKYLQQEATNLSANKGAKQMIPILPKLN